METRWEFIMKETETRYYCIICGCDVFGTRNVENHFHGYRHADSLDKYGRNISTDDGLYQYYCDLCECTVSGYINVRGHITGKQHTNFLENSEDESEESEDESEESEDESEESEDESETSNEGVQYDQMESDDFIRHYCGTDEYICFLCDEEFESRWKTDYHLKGWEHSKAYKIYGCKISNSETGWYYCELCDCYMNSWKNVYPHLNGLRHENNM